MINHLNNQFKVLHLLGSVGKGGAEVMLLDLLRYCEKNKDFNISLLFYNEGYLKSNFLELKNALFVQPKTKIHLFSEIRRFVKTAKINIIHCHAPIHVLYAYISTIGLPVKIIQTSHGFNPCRKSKFLLNLAISLSAKTLFVSASFENRLKLNFEFKENKKHKTLYNGIDTCKISLFPNKAQKFDRKVRIGMVGNFYNDGRDQLSVCKSAKLMKEKELNFKLYFAGGARKENTYYFDQCFNYVTSNGLTKIVNFLGFQDDIYSLLKEWDIFIYFSNRDTFGIAVVEAMMAGIPVIVNDLDVFVEITENGKYATLFKTKDPEDLARQIEAYIKDPKPFKEKAQKAALYAREKFSIEKHYDDLMDVYKTLSHS